MFAGGPGAIALAVPALIWCGLTYSVFFVSVLAVAFTFWSLSVIGADYLQALPGVHDGGAIGSLKLAAFMMALAPVALSIVMRNRGELAESPPATRRKIDTALQADEVVGTWKLDVASDTITIEAIDPDSRLALPRREWSVERALDSVHPDDRKRVSDALKSSVATGAQLYCKYKGVMDGRLRWFAAFGKPVFDQRKAVSHVIGVLIDLTDRMTAAEALEHSDMRFNIVSESIPDIVWSTDGNGRHDYFNRRWHEFTGIESGDTGPGTWTGLIHPDDERRVMETWAACLSTGDPYALDYRFRYRDGSYRWLRVQAQPLRNAQDIIVRWYGTSTDIDDAKRLEAEREAVARELDHRIGNLFVLVNGLVSMSVREGGALPVVAESIRGRLRALHDAHRLIRRADAGGATMTALLRTLLRPYDDGSGRISVAGDDVQIAALAVTSVALVFHELATNAVKYGALRDDAGVLHVTLSRQGEHLAIVWKEECLSPSPVSEGSGFGSNLLRTVIEGQLRGVAARSPTPHGLTIDISLPLSSLT